MEKTKPTYKAVTKYTYDNARLEGGLVQNSIHPQNTVYVKIDVDGDTEYIHELTVEEALVIGLCLSNAVLASLGSTKQEA